MEKSNICRNFALAFEKESNDGAIAQLVEQRTENPCVPGSIPGGTTERNANNLKTRLLAFFFCLGPQFWQHLTNILILFSPFLQGIIIKKRR